MAAHASKLYQEAPWSATRSYSTGTADALDSGGWPLHAASLAGPPPITTSTVASGTGSTIERTLALAMSPGRSPLEEALCETLPTPDGEVKVYLLSIG